MQGKIEFDKIWNFRRLDETDVNIPLELSSPSILFAVKGCIEVVCKDNTRMTLQSNRMTLIPSAGTFRITANESVNLFACGFSMEYIFSESHLSNVFEFSASEAFESYYSLPIKRIILRFLSYIEACLKMGINSAYFFELKRNEFYHILLYLYQKSELSSFFAETVSKNIRFKKFVWDNYQSVKNVTELAALANYSTSGFIKKFKKSFDESPYRWMQMRKSQQILQEINKGVKPLQEISDDYGFSSYQHFANFCKNIFGFPPSEILGKNISQIAKNL
ncbi:MAG: helix-turn-helix transcriptional regulator [Dysgonamonadaceae bacterium]|jgi:AraC-like DNA-binding protein|nr:helix-turn-helix transcriptional regulator [Dysgonamonadaceae bacterium]